MYCKILNTINDIIITPGQNLNQNQSQGQLKLGRYQRNKNSKGKPTFYKNESCPRNK